MPKSRLSDVSIRSAKPGMYWDDLPGLPGFGLRVGSRTKTFIVLNGSGRRKTIGQYPVISLARARDEARKVLAKRTLGFRLPSPTATFNEAVDAFFPAAELKLRPRTVQDYQYHLNRHWRPSFGTRKLSDISRRDISNKLKTLFHTPSEADHALVYLKGFYSWAVQSGYTETNPCARMPSVAPYKSRERVLTDQEIKAVWNACEGVHGTIVKLLILTGQRRGEIAALRAEWIHGDRITLPKEICKNGREHTFPFGKLAHALVDDKTAKNTLIFPARGSLPTPFNGWSKSKAALDKASAVQRWALHDLRRTFATKLAALGVAQPVTEKLLNHVSGIHSGVSGIYNRHTYFEEMKTAIALYEAHILTVVS